MNKPASAGAGGLLAFLLTPQNCRRAALVFFAAMVLAGSVPGQAEALTSVIYDKLLHFLAYSILSALVYCAVQGGPLRRMLLTLVGVALLGAADETLQALFSYRTASLLDWQIDMLAACVTVTLLGSIQAMRATSRTR